MKKLQKQLKMIKKSNWEIRWKRYLEKERMKAEKAWKEFNKQLSKT